MKEHRFSYFGTIALALLITLCWTACQPKAPKEPSWLDRALQTEQYLRTATVSEAGGVAWKVMPDSLNSGADASLYSGTPGVVLFYLELYHATQDTSYLMTALDGADFLLGSLPDTIPSNNSVGLYTGLAGIGYTLSEVYKAAENKKYRAGIFNIVHMLDSAAQRTENGAHWGQISDIVYGGAGIGLFLNRVADQFDFSLPDSLSQQVAKQLLAQRTEEPEGYRWKMNPSMEIHMDNFSHGTAGVAYYLLEMHERTEKLEYLEAAVAAGNWLAVHTNTDGFVAHHLPGGEDLYYQSWCHGPAGTSRLYYRLWDITGNQKWMDLILKGAAGTMAQGLDSGQTPGFWNNVGKCCGDVGVAEHYLWLYEITGNNDYLDFAYRMTEKAVNLGTPGTAGLKWVHAENRRSPEQVAAQTGLMQGSAGMGLWFLQLDAQQKGKKPGILLPDKPAPASGL